MRCGSILRPQRPRRRCEKIDGIAFHLSLTCGSPNLKFLSSRKHIVFIADFQTLNSFQLPLGIQTIHTNLQWRLPLLLLAMAPSSSFGRAPGVFSKALRFLLQVDPSGRSWSWGVEQCCRLSFLPGFLFETWRLSRRPKGSSTRSFKSEILEAHACCVPCPVLKRLELLHIGGCSLLISRNMGKNHPSAFLEGTLKSVYEIKPIQLQGCSLPIPRSLPAWRSSIP